MLSLQLRCSANMSYFCTLEIVDKQRFFSLFFFFLKLRLILKRPLFYYKSLTDLKFYEIFELQKILEVLS